LEEFDNIVVLHNHYFSVANVETPCCKAKINKLIIKKVIGECPKCNKEFQTDITQTEDYKRIAARVQYYYIVKFLSQYGAARLHFNDAYMHMIPVIEKDFLRATAALTYKDPSAKSKDLKTGRIKRVNELAFELRPEIKYFWEDES